jgi:hypothetical protein
MCLQSQHFNSRDTPPEYFCKNVNFKFSEFLDIYWDLLIQIDLRRFSRHWLVLESACLVENDGKK